MATSDYDLNLQLALATTAEYEGDLDAALAFLAEARRLAGEDREARVHLRRRARSMMARASMSALGAVI